MRWFVTCILLVSALIPVLALKSYFISWTEGVAELKRVYPEHTYIDIGGVSRWGTSGDFKRRDYLLIPGFQIVRVSKTEEQPVSVQVKFEHGLIPFGASFLTLGGLLIFVAIPYVRTHGISSP